MEDKKIQGYTAEEKKFLAAGNDMDIDKSNNPNLVSDVAKYLHSNLKNQSNFNYSNHTLLSNNPALFEDLDYLRTRNFIKNEITDVEIQAYKRGELREVYNTFETMLICNLQYYDRIMSYCTMVFNHYIRIDDDFVASDHLDKVPYELEMTPTKIWCSALTSIHSTEFELKYAWGKNLKFEPPVDNKSVLETNFGLLYSNITFSKFIEYRSTLIGVNGFNSTYHADTTPNRKLAQICGKFTTSSTALSEKQLYGISDYILEQESVLKRLYNSLFECMSKMFYGDDNQFAVYVYSNEFIIHSAKFSMKVTKNENGQISKEYLANSFECFAAEQFLVDSIKYQIEWAKYKLPEQYEYDKKILRQLLYSMIKKDFRETTCIKRMNEYGVISKITFSGIFDRVYINEDFMIDNRTIRSTRICLGKENAVRYIINKGYYIFGLDDDLFNIGFELNRKVIIAHYSRYLIPVMIHMRDMIMIYKHNMNDIINFITGDKIPEFNNANIKYTVLKQMPNSRKIMSEVIKYQFKDKQHKSKSYWEVMDY